MEVAVSGYVIMCVYVVLMQILPCESNSDALLNELIPRTTGRRILKRDESDTKKIGINLFDLRFSLNELLHIRDYPTAFLELIEINHEAPQNCTEYSLKDFDYRIPDKVYDKYKSIEDSTILIANNLQLFLYKNPGEQETQDLYSDALYYSNIKSLLISDNKIQAVSIGFDELIFKNNSLHFCPYAYKTKDNKIITKDLNLDCNYAMNFTSKNRWFLDQKWKTPPKFNTSNIASYKITSLDGKWTGPYFDCNGSSIWMTSYSLPIYDWDDNGSLEFKGAIGVHVSLENYDIDQCAHDDSSFFAGSHKCKQETTECIHKPGGGFRRGSYYCRCKPGYIFPGEEVPNNQSYFNGTDLEEDYILQTLGTDDTYIPNPNHQCGPCRNRCPDCENDGLCYIEHDDLVKGITLGFQGFFITIAFILGCVVLYMRSDKVFKLSMWPLLEIMLVGSICMYITVIVMYLEPSSVTCLLVPWFREVGFAILYGALILKVYRVLAEFQTRKARRVHVRDKDLLKYVLIIVVVVVGYMASWTAVKIEHKQPDMVKPMQLPDGLWFYTCKSSWWDYFVEIAEFLFVLFGLYLCYCVRSAPSDYFETRFISAALCNELILSAIFHVARHCFDTWLHPDYILLLYFIRCQLTVSITTGLLIGPKIWYAHKPTDFRSRSYSTSETNEAVLPEMMKLTVGVSSNGDVDVGDINLAEMEPEDIRVELKRLYTQLQIYKTKYMRKDNPHISKRKGGKKQGNRRFSLQPFSHQKHKSPRETDHEIHGEFISEVTKTPEESTISADGVFIYDFDNKKTEGPSVTFKPGTKT